MKIKTINKGFYNRYIGELWLWMIFFEWIYNIYLFVLL